MGGFGALDLARLHPRRFCAVGGHSAALWFSVNRALPGAFDNPADFARHDVIAAARAGAFRGIPIRLDTGRSDPFRTAAQAAADALKVRLHQALGGHSVAYWRTQYSEYASWYARRLRRCRLDR